MADVLDKTPNWFMRWGIISVCISVGALFLMAFLIPYRITQDIAVTITPEGSSFIVAPENGKFIHDPLPEKDFIHAGDTLAIIETGRNNPTSITAPRDGYIEFPGKKDIGMQQVKANDTLFIIRPVINSDELITAIAFIDAADYSPKLKENIPAQLSFRFPDGNVRHFEGKVSYLSTIPKTEKQYIATIVFRSNAGNSEIRFYSGMPGNATLELSNKSILYWIFH